MAQQSAQAKPAGTYIAGAINYGANGRTATTKPVQAFAREIAQLSRQALDRTTRYKEELRKAHGMEEVAALQMDFAKESLEHGARHARKLCEMLATLARRNPSRRVAALGHRGGERGPDDRGSRARRRGEGQAPYRT